MLGRARFELVKRSESAGPRQLEHILARLGAAQRVRAVGIGLTPVTFGGGDERENVVGMGPCSWTAAPPGRSASL